MNKTIHIKYFALFREQANTGTETVSTSAETAADLFKELAAKYRFTLDADHIRVSVNDAYQCINSTLNDNDAVVFIPPVAGG